MTADDSLRRIGTFTAACVLVSNAVGSGIFTTTGFMARDLGDPRIIIGLWALGGALALAGAMSYAELGASMPRVGGDYIYVRRAFGPVWGFLSGWTSFTVGFGAAIAAASVAFAQYALVLLPESFAMRSPAVFALLLVWTLTAVHALGVERGGLFQQIITIVKIGGIALGVLAAFVYGDGSVAGIVTPSPDAAPRIGAAAVGLVFVLYSYSGWNAAGYIAGEIREPGRSIPRAMVLGTLFIGALYVAVNAAYFYALPTEALAADPVLPVAEKSAQALFGSSAAAAVVAILCVSIAGATSSMIWAGPRVYWAMADDGVAPALLAKTSRNDAPIPALLIQSAWVTVLVLSGSFEQLVIYSGVALALFSALSVGSTLVLRRREPELARPYRVSPYPWIPLAYIAASLWIASYASLERPIEALLSLGTVTAGLPFYWIWTRGGPRS